MSPLLLRCVLCGRTQAEGLLSRASWGHVERPTATAVPASQRTAVVSACPGCKARHPDWEQRLQAVVNGTPGA